jgi:hypothetical protein
VLDEGEKGRRRLMKTTKSPSVSRLRLLSSTVPCLSVHFASMIEERQSRRRSLSTLRPSTRQKRPSQFLFFRSSPVTQSSPLTFHRCSPSLMSSARKKRGRKVVNRAFDDTPKLDLLSSERSRSVPLHILVLSSSRQNNGRRMVDSLSLLPVTSLTALPPCLSPFLLPPPPVAPSPPLR